MFGRLGPWEIALILVIVIIVFGAGKLPQVGGAIGKSIRSFRKGQAGEFDEDEEDEEEEPAKPRTAGTTRRKKRTGSKS